MDAKLLHPSGTRSTQSSLPRWFALDFDGKPWKTIAISLFATQVALFLVALLADALWFAATSSGFFGAMLLFAAFVFVDAYSVRMGIKRAVIWAAVVTFGWIFGAVPYALRRQHLRRGHAR